MRVRLRLALFWVLLATALGWAGATGAIYVFSSGFDIRWFRYLDFHFDIGAGDIVLAALLAAAAGAAWSSKARRWAARAIPWAPRIGPWIFAALAFQAAWPSVRGSQAGAAAMMGLCALAALGAVRYLLRRPEDRARARRAAAWLARRRGPWFWTFTAFVALVAIQWHVYRGQAAYGDAVSQLFQGLILASGHWKWPAWEYPLFFTGPGVIIEGGWYSQYPPGHCVLLALGWLVHAPWLVGPILGALSAWLVWDCGRMLYGARAGVLAAAFFVANPWWPIMSGSYMNHVSALFWLALSLDLGVRVLEGAGLTASFAAGFALGGAAATRPLTAAAFGAPGIAVWGRSWLRRGRPTGRCLAAGALGFAAWVGIFMTYNRGTTGDPLLSGYERLGGAQVEPGFHAGNRHTPLKGLEQTATNLSEYRHWAPVAAPGLFLPLAWTLLFARLGRREGFLLGQWGLMCMIYFIYFYEDLMIGPRYLYESIVPYSLLAAGGFLNAADRVEGWMSRAAGRPLSLGRTATWLAAGLCLASAAAGLERIEYFHAADQPEQRRLAFLRSRFTDPRAVVFINMPSYGRAFLDTARHLEGPLFLDSVGDDWNRRFMAANPGREYYYMDRGGCWPYGETPIQDLRGRKMVHWDPRTRSAEGTVALFHNPAGRPLPPVGSGGGR
ncbi:MAG: hypothetical protein NTW86_08900 [Candidatus Sumerlaeota bacterium]|nr:hypothetical protein [Candidatus Sumerlaeota bacterium]